MAIATVVVPALEWKSLDGSSENLFSVLRLDFTVYEGYAITAQGNFGQSFNRVPVGGVIDNLDNPTFVLLDLNGYPERVAPYSKSPLRFQRAGNGLKAQALGGIVTLTLFTGFCPGAPYGINPFGAK